MFLLVGQLYCTVETARLGWGCGQPCFTFDKAFFFTFDNATRALFRVCLSLPSLLVILSAWRLGRYSLPPVLAEGRSAPGLISHSPPPPFPSHIFSPSVSHAFHNGYLVGDAASVTRARGDRSPSRCLEYSRAPGDKCASNHSPTPGGVSDGTSASRFGVVAGRRQGSRCLLLMSIIY